MRSARENLRFATLSAAWLTIMMVLVLIACERTGSSRAEGAVFDEPMLSSADGARIDVSPEVDSLPIAGTAPIQVIGTAQGDEPYLFQEIADVQVHAGRAELYVADAGRKQILVYSMSNGQFRRTIGSPGGGPGEFQELETIFLVDDSIVGAWDPALARVSLFSSAGTEVATLALERPRAGGVNLRLGRTSRRLRWSPDGYLLEMRSNPLEVAPEEQVGALVRLDHELGVRDTILRYLVPAVRAAQSAGSGGRTTRYEAPPIFSPSASWALGPDGTVAFAPGGPYEIVLLKPGGERQATALSRPVPVEPVTIDDRLKVLEHEAGKSGSGFPPGFAISEFEPRVRDRFSARRPSITGLLWDGPGRLWVRRFDTKFDPEGPGGTWDVIDLDERRIRHVLRFEEGLTPVATLEHRIYCVQRDSLGVERLLMLAHPLGGASR